MDLGVISHGELESLIGRLSFSQTSIFGRIGRSMLAPLYIKLKTRYYHPLISPAEMNLLSWWTTTLADMGPRVVRPRTNMAELVIFTDAATKTMTIAAVTVTRTTFKRDESISLVQDSVVGKYWEATFDKTSLIYGLEMLALLARLWGPNPDLVGKAIIFHIDNKNAFEAIIKNNARPSVITATTHLIWHRIRQLGITAWFEWVPSNRNIADLPTRSVQLPFTVAERRPFSGLRTLSNKIKEAENALLLGRPAPIPSDFI